MPARLALALALLLSAAAVAPPHGAAAPEPAWIVCTPTALYLQGQPARPGRHPIAAALEEARPGAVVYVEPGDYPPLRIGFDNHAPDNARTTGGRPGAPIVVQGRGRVRILGVTDAISIHQDPGVGWITFRDLEIRPGTRSGVHFFRPSAGREHRGFRFEDCDVIADFDHASGQGASSKWGIWANGLADFAFVGVRRPARVENVRHEHGFYLQNPQGPILIENVHARALGRTFVQLTSRPGDGPPGTGDVTVRGCEVEDVGLSAWDGYKGGSAFTVAGGLRGRVLLERNRYRAGFDRSLARLTKDGAPYGTGAFVAWREGSAEPNALVVLRDNTFEFAPSCGDRPVVSIAGCERVEIVGRNELVSGGTQPALRIERGPGAGTRSRGGDLRVDRRTVLEGALVVDGEPRELADLAR